MRRKAPSPQSLSSLTLVASLAALASACGGGGGIDSPSSSGSDHEADGTGEVLESQAMLLTPPPEFYNAMAARILRLAQSKDYEVAGSTSTPTLRLIFGGATVARGFGPGQSHLLCADSAAIPASSLAEADRAAAVAAVESAVAAAGADIAVVQEGDAEAGGTTIVVGGSYEDLGCRSEDQGVTAVAPIDQGNLSNDDVGFVFDGSDPAAMTGTLGKVAEAMADPKHAAKALADRVPVEDAALPGIPELSDMGDLLWQIKSADKGIDLTLLRAELDRLIPGGSSDIAGIERLMAATVGAVQSAQTPGAGTPPPSTQGPAAQIGAAVGAVDPNTVATVATMAGHPEIAVAVMILGPLIGMGSTPATTPTPGTGTGTTPVAGGSSAAVPPPQVTLPDYAAFLSLPKFTDLNTWEGAFLGHVRYINQHYVGDTQESLQALAIMAYAKARPTGGK